MAGHRRHVHERCPAAQFVAAAIDTIAEVGYPQATLARTRLFA